MTFATTQTAQAAPGGFAGFFMEYGLIILLGVLIIFMFWSSRRRQQKMKAEQESKAKAMVPGVEVLLQGGLYGTLVEYDGEDLSKAALVELAPGTVIKVHSQGILRVVEDEPLVPMDDAPVEESPDVEIAPDAAPAHEAPAIADAPAAAEATAEPVDEPNSDDKPKA